MKEDYRALLAPKRLRKSSRGALGLLQESESDRARILYSAAFRRLQRKTQVFPLEENAAVRSRLTHSLEVAHVGRYIATTVIEKFKAKKRLAKLKLDAEACLAFTNVVDAACLAHDIGNPPFGHFGEAAIAGWAHEWQRRAGIIPEGSVAPVEERFLDFLKFDGNPQGLRIVTRLAGVDGFGMNLTAAQIAAIVKYPCSTCETDDNIPIRKKGGVFTSEKSVWEWIQAHYDMADHVRFPLAFLMEAADDISYCLSDIEDGIEKEYIDHEHFFEKVHDRLSGDKAGTAKFLQRILKDASKNRKLVDPTVYVRTKLVRMLVEEAADAYVENHDDIFAGNAVQLLDKSGKPYLLLKAIRMTVEEKLYGLKPSVRLELAGLTAIRGILERFEPLIGLPEDDFAQLPNKRVPARLVESQRLYSLLPPKYVAQYRRLGKFGTQSDRLYARCQLLTDFVAGMTDVFALHTYQMLAGIR